MGEFGNRPPEGADKLVEKAKQVLLQRNNEMARGIARLEATGVLKKIWPGSEAVARISQYLNEPSTSPAAKFLESTPDVADFLSHAASGPKHDKDFLDPRIARSLGLKNDNWGGKETERLFYYEDPEHFKIQRIVAELRAYSFLSPKVLEAVNDEFSDQLFREYRFVDLPIPPQIKMQVQKKRRLSASAFIEDALHEEATEVSQAHPDSSFARSREKRKDMRRLEIERLQKEFPDPHVLVEQLLESPLRPKR
jgi:hypothetical protein